MFSIFRLKWVSLSVTSSMLRSKLELEQWLGGVEEDSKLQAQWSETTTHLAMTSISLSLKVVNCLAKGVPIVTPEYFRDYLTSLQTKQPLPLSSNYVPPVTETQSESQLRDPNISFRTDSSRASLLRGITLVFLTQKELTANSVPISLAGGSSRMWPGGDLEQLSTSGVVVVQPPASLRNSQTQAASDWSAILSHLEKKKLVACPATHIYLAIVHNSLAVHCNPRRSAAVAVLPPKQPVAVEGRVSVMETQGTAALSSRPGPPLTTPGPAPTTAAGVAPTPAAPLAAAGPSDTGTELLEVADDEDTRGPSTLVSTSRTQEPSGTLRTQASGTLSNRKNTTSSTLRTQQSSSTLQTFATPSAPVRKRGREEEESKENRSSIKETPSAPAPKRMFSQNHGTLQDTLVSQSADGAEEGQKTSSSFSEETKKRPPPPVELASQAKRPKRGGREEEEDIFGFDDSPIKSGVVEQNPKKQRGGNDQEDIFGFDDSPVKSSVPPVGSQLLQQENEEEGDIFGFSPAKKGRSPPSTQKPIVRPPSTLPSLALSNVTHISATPSSCSPSPSRSVIEAGERSRSQQEEARSQREETSLLAAGFIGKGDTSIKSETKGEEGDEDVTKAFCKVILLVILTQKSS